MKKGHTGIMLWKSMGIILMMLLVLAVSGFSYTVHYCHGSRADYALFPALTHAEASCGCEDDISCTSPSMQVQHFPVIHKQGCCKDFKYYQRVLPQSFNDFQSKVISAVSFVQDFGAVTLTDDVKAAAADKFLFCIDYSPPPLPSGRNLVFLLNQIRIPFVQGNC